MSTFQFDPDINKVTNSYGGYDPNEKGLTQYPRYKRGIINPTDCSFQNPFPAREQTSRSKVFSNPILDPVTRHYRRFVEDPGLHRPVEHEDIHSREITCMDDNISKSSCFKNGGRADSLPRMRKPIDPIHWKADLFDTSYEKYYLRNLINEDPYRQFLTSYSEAIVPPYYLTEYKERFSGNPAMQSSSPGTIPGLSRPTDITETCHWRRHVTSKLRDAVFDHEKDPIDSHLDYNDPKRYNPWGRHLAGHSLLTEPNYRPRPGSGIEYSVTTVLPAVSTESRGWIV